MGVANIFVESCSVALEFKIDYQSKLKILITFEVEGEKTMV